MNAVLAGFSRHIFLNFSLWVVPGYGSKDSTTKKRKGEIVREPTDRIRPKENREEDVPRPVPRIISKGQPVHFSSPPAPAPFPCSSLPQTTLGTVFAFPVTRHFFPGGKRPTMRLLSKQRARESFCEKAALWAFYQPG